MANTTYVDYSTPAINAAWLNDVNRAIYALLGTGPSAPLTRADIMTNLFSGGFIGGQSASNVAITGGSITGITDLAIADGGTGASTAANARTNLGATTIGSTVFTSATSDLALKALEATRPAMRAGLSAAAIAMGIGVNTVLVANTVAFDTTTAYSAATGRYTPQVAGYYQVSGALGITSAGAANFFTMVLKNGVEDLRGVRMTMTGAGNYGCAVSGLVLLNGTTDYIQIAGYTSAAANIDTGVVLSNFSAHLVHAI